MQHTIKHILVPVDGSADSVRAAALAGVLAKAVGARVSLAHVLDADSMPLVGAPALSKEELGSAIAQDTERTVRGAIDALQQAGIDPSTVTLRGKPGEEIVRHAREQVVDLVVMGSRGLSPLGQVMLGSISSHVLQNATCPVTVVR